MTRLIEEGVRAVRINFSHGSFDDFAKYLEVIREASRRTGVAVGIMGDLSGPKIRLGKVAGGSLELTPGDQVVFLNDGDTVRREGERVLVPTSYDLLVSEVQPGHRVLIDDGNVRLLAVERRQGQLVCQVTVGGPISDRKGVNLPDTCLSMPSMTDYDQTCVDWAVQNKVDYLALSFVRQAGDVQELKQKLSVACQTHGCEQRVPIIAKIEKPEALRDLEAITAISDAIMVARGDLGVEMNLAEVPLIQKRIVRMAHDHGKPVVVATQMLQSMIEQATPTRAEVSDVANAILDGADALMLSGETAVGKYPVRAVRMMSQTAGITEIERIASRNGIARPPKHPQASRYRTAALAHGVTAVAQDLAAKFVVMWSERGGGARYLSQNRLSVPIIAVSSSNAALRTMSLMFGVTAVGMPRPEHTNDFVAKVDDLLLDNDWASMGDPVVLVMGEPLGTAGVTNELRIHYAGDTRRGR